MKPRIAFVVQRCGQEVNGGAEAHCLLAARNMKDIWDVEVLTTCARDYLSWDDVYPEGVQVVQGVPIRRFKVDYPRDIEKFNAYSGWIHAKQGKVQTADAEKWMKLQGPMDSRLLEYIQAQSSRYDAFIFFTYLYATTYYGLPLVSDKAYLVPTAHDEWPIYLPIWDAFFTKPKAFIFNTPEERNFLKKRFPEASLPGEIVGVGVDIPGNFSGGNFRKKFNLTDPYLLYLGRIDESKGCGQLIDYYLRFKRENAMAIKLVLAGKAVMPIPKDPDIIELGFIDEQTKFDALDGCEFLVNPSPFESLSMVLLEAWALNKPVLVSAGSEVMVGQCRRSNSGLWYANYDEFSVCTKYLLTNKNIAQRARSFVEENYRWEVIKDKYCKTVTPGQAGNCMELGGLGSGPKGRS